MSEQKSASKIAWISAAAALAALVLSARGQMADMNRLGVDDAVNLSNTLTRIDGKLNTIRTDVDEIKDQGKEHRSETRRFQNCANGNFDAIAMQGVPNRDCSNIGNGS